MLFYDSYILQKKYNTLASSVFSVVFFTERMFYTSFHIVVVFYEDRFKPT